MTALLQAQGIGVWRGEDWLLDDVSFTLDEQSVTRISGSNGSGKTTLLRILCGLGIADEGSVYWRGQPIHKVRDEFNASLLYLGHKPGIKSALTPIENLRLYSQLAGRPISAEDESSLLQALETLSIGDKAELPCRVLSAGQQRRVSLCRLLLEPAKLWVLDEPLTSLDKAGHDWVSAAVAHQLDQGGAVILTTHTDLDIPGYSIEELSLD